MNVLGTLARFGSTGAIGPLRCGATLDEIEATLGPPWDIGPVSKRRRWPHLFSYGDAELCVCRCRRITLISVQTWRDAIELPVPGTTTLATFAGPLTHTHVTAELNSAGCRLRPVTLHQPPGQLALQAETTGVTFTFRAEADAEPLLASAGHWISSHECTPAARRSG
ncbi:hypothetical protein [Streptomyces sp. NPDC059166]|uniref:hypothetical protein n=1 Tax=Streptomyces sp. NPDC059166 TaxID=3346752 RepID=UPI003690F424